MTPPTARELRAVLADVANALQGVAGLVTHPRRNTQTTADDAVALEAAVGRAVSALKRLQPPPTRRRTDEAAVYARVSTLDQEPENQLQELRRYVQARDWTADEYVDRGVSGAKDRRPAHDQLLTDARRRRFDVLVCWRLDRLGRNRRHLILLLDEIQAVGMAFVSLAEGIDATTPAGRLQLHVLGAIAEFEKARIAERVRAGLQRARNQGVRLGRPKRNPPADRLVGLEGLTIRQVAERLGVSRSTAQRWLRNVRRQSAICLE